MDDQRILWLDIIIILVVSVLSVFFAVVITLLSLKYATRRDRLYLSVSQSRCMRFWGFSGLGEPHPSIPSSEVPSYYELICNSKSVKVVNFIRLTYQSNRDLQGITYQNATTIRPARPPRSQNSSTTRDINPPCYDDVVITIDLPTYNEAIQSR